MPRPRLDVSDVLLDPDFCDTTLQCIRSIETVSSGGLSSISITTIGFAGVVTSRSGDVLERLSDGERIRGSITVITRFLLRAGGPNVTADIVQWSGRQYTAQIVNNYSTYGRGFVEVDCDLIPLSG